MTCWIATWLLNISSSFSTPRKAAGEEGGGGRGTEDVSNVYTYGIPLNNVVTRQLEKDACENWGIGNSCSPMDEPMQIQGSVRSIARAKP